MDLALNLVRVSSHYAAAHMQSHSNSDDKGVALRQDLEIEQRGKGFFGRLSGGQAVP